LVSGSGLPRSTAVRIIQTLQDYGLVEKRKFLYKLTSQFRAWASTDRYSLLRARCRPILEAVSTEAKELVLAGLREGTAIIHIAYIEWDHIIRIAPTPHTRHPWHTHALGKLAMSLQPNIMERTKNRKLREELNEIKRTGVAWNREESESGMIALATWGMCQSPAEPMIAVAWLAFRFSEKAAAKALTVIREAAKRGLRREAP